MKADRLSFRNHSDSSPPVGFTTCSYCHHNRWQVYQWSSIWWIVSKMRDVFPGVGSPALAHFTTHSVAIEALSVSVSRLRTSELGGGWGFAWKADLVWGVEGSGLPPGRGAAGLAAGCSASRLLAWCPFSPAFGLSVSSEIVLINKIKNNKNKKVMVWRR